MKKPTASKGIAYCVVGLDVIATLATLALCYISVFRGFMGALPYLTALIGALQAATAVILNGYYGKAKAENKKGGIVYDTAMQDKTGNGRTI